MADDNLSDVMAWLNGVLDEIRFDRTGEEQALGRELAGVVAHEIADAGAAGEAPDGTPWDANAPKYAAWKAKHYGVGEHAPLIRTGQLLSLQSLTGDPVVTADAVEMRYGIGEPPSRSSTGAELTEGDRTITDVEKAYLVSAARPFYFMSETIADACLEHAGPAVARWIGEA